MAKGCGMVAQADVVVANLSLGSGECMGLGYGGLKQVHLVIIWQEGTGASGNTNEKHQTQPEKSHLSIQVTESFVI